jgi:hypothetical protein
MMTKNLLSEDAYEPHRVLGSFGNHVVLMKKAPDAAMRAKGPTSKKKDIGTTLPKGIRHS